MYNFRFLSDTAVQENIDAWIKVEKLADIDSVSNHATECIDALQREQAIRAIYDELTEAEVSAFCELAGACKRTFINVRNSIIDMGIDPKRVDAFMRYYEGTGRQG